MSGGLRKRKAPEAADASTFSQQQVIEKICGVQITNNGGLNYQVQHRGESIPKWLAEHQMTGKAEMIKAFFEAIPKESYENPTTSSAEESTEKSSPPEVAPKCERQSESKKALESAPALKFKKEKGSTKEKARKISTKINKMKKSVKREPTKKNKVGTGKVVKRKGVKPIK